MDCRSSRAFGMAVPASFHKPKNRIRPAGLEPATLGLEIPCSIHLSYGRVFSTYFYHGGGGSEKGASFRPDNRAACAAALRG